jgi:alginate O-acetyltransferase complex protein AlgI
MCQTMVAKMLGYVRARRPEADLSNRCESSFEGREMLLRAILYSLIFLICVIFCSKVRSRAGRQIVLLTCSYILYLSWSAWFASILLASTGMNFLLGKWLRKRASGLVLSLGVFLNLVLLGSFKYLPEISAHLPLSSFEFQRFSHLALPLGISFWTFQAMSYLFDLYRGDRLDPSFGEFALFMVFFPVAISGPICRLPAMLPQFRADKTTGARDIEGGLARIATGVLMIEVAQLLAQGIFSGDGISSGFDQVRHWSGADVWCLAFGYGFELFLDFAGYSHIAIGSAQALGFTVPENFVRPFESTRPSIFWTRWHMSLSFWIRDYVFLFLIVFRRNAWWRNSVFVISMVLFGLWHKATVLFLLWGLYHGILLVLDRQIEAAQRKFDWTPSSALWTPISWLVTVSLVSLGWIFFRANSLAEARQMFSAVVSADGYLTRTLSGSLYLLVAMVAIGYAIVVSTSSALARYSTHPILSRDAADSGMAARFARHRRYWLPPLYMLTLFAVIALTQTPGANPAQLLYRNF